MGCGCGGAATTGCGCGGAGSSPAAAGSGFVRPTFFDGQLLCAEDLQAAVDYTQGKNRLHLRHLVGDGVVCGLDVTCSRGHRGSVAVRAGYALDRCGRDIVVPCDETVDVLALVRDLHADPCTPATASADPSAVPRRYELLVEYAETSADPVAPYVTDDDGVTACTPTRVREGYRFAVRCRPGKKPAELGLLAALARCDELREQVRLVTEAAAEVATVVDAGDPDVPDKPAVDDAGRGALELLKADADPGGAVRIAAAAAGRAAVPERTGAPKRATDLLTGLDRVLTSLRGIDHDPVTTARLAEIDAWRVDLTRRLTARPVDLTRQDRRMAVGAVTGERTFAALVAVTRDGLDVALCRLDAGPGTRCRDRDELAAVRLPDLEDYVALGTALSSVVTVLRHLLADCLCAAVAPPCPAGDDEGQVLAVVDVEGCDVVEVCGAARRYALTGPALSHWLPLRRIYDRIEEACCGDGDPVELAEVFRSRFGTTPDG